jgi:hypothetical protein
MPHGFISISCQGTGGRETLVVVIRPASMNAKIADDIFAPTRELPRACGLHRLAGPGHMTYRRYLAYTQ